MRGRRYSHSDKSASHSIPYHHQYRHHRHHHHMNHEVDDWICPNCHALVFAFRSCCYKCQTPRHEGGGGGEGAPLETPLDVYYTPRPPLYGDVREGDWLCIGCGGHNFAFKIACFTCRTPRPQGEYPYQPPAPHHQHQHPHNIPLYGAVETMPIPMMMANATTADVSATTTTTNDAAGAILVETSAPSSAPNPHHPLHYLPHAIDHHTENHGAPAFIPPSVLPGDWTFTNCHENVFAKRNRCYKCYTSRPR